MMDWLQFVVMHAAQLLGAPLGAAKVFVENGEAGELIGPAGVVGTEDGYPIRGLPAGERVNPTTGLTMFGCFDAGGYLYGEDPNDR